jgi:molybdopterin synthase sulfur carrier subunit
MHSEMTKINVLTFGAIADITGKKSFEMEGINSTQQLVQVLEEKYPLLKTVQYAIAVDKEVIQEHINLSGNVTIAILPPFSGG